MSEAPAATAVPTGNTYDKYGSANPVVRRLMARFERDMAELLQIARPGSILDAHTAHERIALAELAAGTDAYMRLVRTLLQGRVAA